MNKALATMVMQPPPSVYLVSRSMRYTGADDVVVVDGARVGGLVGEGAWRRRGRGMIWVRPGLRREPRAGERTLAPVDTALFDVDGVLIDTTASYLRAVIAGSERLVRAAGLEPPSPMVSPTDVAAFKLAGGFNSDWDCTRLFAALWTARLREWRDRPEAETSMAEWAARATEAARDGRGGLVWLRASVPPSALPSAEEARWAHDEHYWGAALCRALFAHESRYAPDAAGFVHDEELLLDDALLPALASRGIDRFGLITGREGPEVTWALRAIARLYPEPPAGGEAPGRLLSWHASDYGRSPFGAIVPATEAPKPEPRALALALARLGSRGAVYVGDTADDLELVLRYRREARPADPGAPPVFAAMIAEGLAADVFRDRGVDMILSRVTELPAALDRLAGGGIESA